MRAFIILAATVGLASLPHATAWGAAGHEIVAIIAQAHISQQVLNTLCSILDTSDGGGGGGNGDGDGNDQARADPPCYLSSVATWADKIRFRARWSAPLHFINPAGDHPPDNCLYPGDGGWQGGDRANVLDAVQNVSSILTDFASGSLSPGLSTAAGAPELAQEALKFLIHFVGDMHQPLHITGRDRGGNSDKVHWDGRVTNLHSVWDNALIAKAIRTTPANYSNPIRAPTLESSLRGAIYDPYVRRIAWEGLGLGRGIGRWRREVPQWITCPAAPESVRAPSDPQEVVLAAPRKPRPGRAGGPPLTSDSDTLCPYGWTAPIHKLNCDIVWPPELDNPDPSQEYLELDTPQYSGSIEKDWVVEKLLAQAGVRLAGILNGIFLPAPGR